MTDPSLFPPSLPVMDTVRHAPGGREWIARLPSAVRELRDRWELRLGAPYHGGSCSWVAPARRADGTAAVLKVTWPHLEARPEGEVLRLWAGRGAVLLYEHEPWLYALLLERCEPGTELGAAGGVPAEERLVLGAEVLRRLWEQGPPERRREVPSVQALSEVTAEWADLLEERAARLAGPAGLDVGLCALAAQLLRGLPLDAPRHAVLHGDFNPGNLLAAAREPWLAIDAKPLFGDTAFDPWRLIEQIDDPFAHPDPLRVLARRTALVADAAGEDVARVRAWSLARHVEFALWTAGRDGADAHSGDGQGGALRKAVRLMGQARILAGLAGL